MAKATVGWSENDDLFIKIMTFGFSIHFKGTQPPIFLLSYPVALKKTGFDHFMFR